MQQARLPSGLRVHRIWKPRYSSDGRRPIAFVTERRRRLTGGAGIAVGLIELLAVFALHAPLWLVFAGLAVSVAGGLYANGGRAGFYELEEDGTLGAYLGRTRPDLDSMA